MKFALSLLALVAAAHARNLLVDIEDNTAYNYFTRFGFPLAEKIRAAEEAAARENRIIGGSSAALGQINYQAGLLAQHAQGQGVCGGSLISKDRVLTAAHCWFDGVNQASSFLVVLGSVTLFSGGTRTPSSDVVLHSAWTPTLVRNDICIIKLVAPVTLGDNIGLVYLPTGSEINENFAGQTAVASGFGLTSDAGSISTSQSLSYVELQVISNNVCFASFPFIVTSSNICTSGADRRSTCRGDSGGPLIINRDGKPILIGATSFGSARGCEVGAPAAFARITSFLDFINANL